MQGAILLIGWTVAIATTPVEVRLETASVDVTLAAGPDAPGTAVVDVAFRGAFARQGKFLCVLASNDDAYDRLAQADVALDARVLAGDLALEGEVSLGDPPTDSSLTSAGRSGCVWLTCVEDACEGRLAVTLVDEADPDTNPPPDDARLDPVGLRIAIVTDAELGELPGEALITLVETQP
ncbi:MAG: hypothetical protein R3B40_13930 [Polyangiales bacterium]